MRIYDGDAREGEEMSLDKLTKRQREVCERVYDGMTLIDIGLILGISPKTVSAHKEKAFKKLGVHNNTQFVKKVMEEHDQLGSK